MSSDGGTKVLVSKSSPLPLTPLSTIQLYFDHLLLTQLTDAVMIFDGHRRVHVYFRLIIHHLQSLPVPPHPSSSMSFVLSLLPSSSRSFILLLSLSLSSSSCVSSRYSLLGRSLGLETPSSTLHPFLKIRYPCTAFFTYL